MRGLKSNRRPLIVRHRRSRRQFDQQDEFEIADWIISQPVESDSQG